MSDRPKVERIAYCECCHARPCEAAPLLGVYVPASGWYCLRCKIAIGNADKATPTPESEAFVRRLRERGAA